jgi:hypothetical protein
MEFACAVPDAETSDRGLGRLERLSSAKSDAHISLGGSMAALELEAAACRGVGRDDTFRDQYTH